MFDFSVVTHWIDTLLRQWLPEWGALLIEFVLVGVVLLLLYAVIALMPNVKYVHSSNVV